jgi:hypothetical protein
VWFFPCSQSLKFFYLEVLSKPCVRFKSKAQADEKAQHTRQYVSILKSFATQLLDLTQGFDPLL